MNSITFFAKQCSYNFNSAKLNSCELINIQWQIASWIFLQKICSILHALAYRRNMIACFSNYYFLSCNLCATIF